MTHPATVAVTATANEPTLTVALSLVIAVLAYSLTARLVPFLAHDLVQKRLRGRDMLKPSFTRHKKTDDSRDDDDGWM